MESRYKRHAGIIFRKIDENYYLARQYQVYQVDEVAFLIWKNCDGIRTIQDLVALVRSEYEVDQDQAHADCTTFLEQAALNGLVTPVL